LVLSDNQIEKTKQLPIAFKLNNLVLSDNSIKKLSKNIGKLSSLQRLSLSRNKLSVFPEFPFLGNLEQLRLNGNRFPAVPPCLSACRRLRLLDLGNNKIDDLALAVGVLRQISLRNLSLRGNPCAQSEAYSAEVAAALPRLEVFDDKVLHALCCLLWRLIVVAVDHACDRLLQTLAKGSENSKKAAIPEPILQAAIQKNSECRSCSGNSFFSCLMLLARVRPREGKPRRPREGKPRPFAAYREFMSNTSPLAWRDGNSCFQLAREHQLPHITGNASSHRLPSPAALAS
jgi:hypothetical protein